MSYYRPSAIGVDRRQRGNVAAVVLVLRVVDPGEEIAPSCHGMRLPRARSG